MSGRGPDLFNKISRGELLHFTFFFTLSRLITFGSYSFSWIFFLFLKKKSQNQAMWIDILVRRTFKCTQVYWDCP